MFAGRFHGTPYLALRIDARRDDLFNERPSILPRVISASITCAAGVKIEKPATMDAVDSTSD